MKQVVGRTLLVLSVGLAVAVGCESKIVENSPDSVGMGMTLDERLQVKTSMDENLFRIDRAIRGIKRITDLFRLSNDNDQKIYSTVDFLIDTNEQLKESFPSKLDNGDYLREASFELPIEEIGADCRRVQTRLTTSTRTIEGSTTNKSDTLIYAFKTCGTNDTFLPILEFTFINNQMKLVANNESLIKVLNGLLNGYSERQSDCSFNFSTEKILTAFNCDNIEVPLVRNKQFRDYAMIDKLSYDTSNGTVFVLEGRIFKDSMLTDTLPGQLTATASLRVDENGDTKFDLRRVEATEQAATAP